MVSLGYIVPERPIPGPDLSFVRLFDDTAVGWQHRGQYVIWTGASVGGKAPHRLLERLDRRVARITHPDGGPVFHKVAAGVPFTIEGAMDFWLTLDSDGVWLDTPSPKGRYAFLAVGGTTGKPGTGVVDWTCGRCGQALDAQPLAIGPRGFGNFMKRAAALALAFDADPARRTCPGCGEVHPPSGALFAPTIVQGVGR